MRRLIVCAALAAPLAMAGLCAAAEEKAGLAHGGPCREVRERRGPAGEKRHEERFRIMAQVLRLTEVQQARIRGILRAEHEENAALIKKIEENRKLLREMSHAANFDEAGLRSLAEKQGQLMARIIVSPVLMRSKVRAVLTPEQRDLDERIQPILERGVEGRAPCFGGEFPPPMGIEMGPPLFPGHEGPFFMEHVQGGGPPCDED